MNTTTCLQPDYTVTSNSEQLSAAHPVRIVTHLFNTKAGNAPDITNLPVPGNAYWARDRRIIEPHDHEHHEIAFILSGEAHHNTPMYESVVQSGDVILVSPGQVHGFTQFDGTVIVNCVYLTEWLYVNLNELLSIEGLVPLFLATGPFARTEDPWISQQRLTPEELDECMHELRSLARECDLENPSHPYLRRCLEKLMIMLGRVFARSENKATHNLLPRKIQVIMRNIENLIVEGVRFKVSDQAETCHLSPDHFTRTFRNAVGMSPMEYYQRRRAQRAAWMLLNTDSSMFEIAMALGYSDPPHLSRLFTRFLGQSPNAYRKRYLT